MILPFVAILTLAAADDAQAKIDEAMQQSCALVKKNLATQQEPCPEEARAMADVDCADKASRKSVDFLKLNVECAKKAKSDAPVGHKGTHCKVLDEAGAVVAEVGTLESPAKCEALVRERAKAAKCAPKKKLSLQFVGEGAPVPYTVTCPAK